MRMILFFLLLSSSISWAQIHKSAKGLFKQPIDSCQVSVYHIVTKEMARNEDDVMEKLLAQRKISIEEAKHVSLMASKKSSYQESRALLTHYNIELNLYRNGAKSGVITLSSITGNISLYNSYDNQESVGNVSAKFGKAFIDLLDRNNLTEYILPVGLQGLNKSEE